MIKLTFVWNKKIPRFTWFYTENTKMPRPSLKSQDLGKIFKHWHHWTPAEHFLNEQENQPQQKTHNFISVCPCHRFHSLISGQLKFSSLLNAFKANVSATIMIKANAIAWAKLNEMTQKKRENVKLEKTHNNTWGTMLYLFYFQLL